MDRTHPSTNLTLVWNLPSRAVRRCLVIGQFICCGEGRSALVPPRELADDTTKR